MVSTSKASDEAGAELPSDVLVVDDDPSNLAAIEEMLRELGVRVTASRSGEECLRHLVHHRFAVVLLDINLPGLSGFETARLIRSREHSRHVPIIFITAQSQEEMFTQCDVLSLHLRLNDETRGLVGLDALSTMKPTALLVNTSRAELIEPDALIAALNRGRPGMAAVDVFEAEPILQGHALLRIENCICTPHIGYVEQENYERMFSEAFDNVVNFIRGTPSNIVNPGSLQVRR